MSKAAAAFAWTPVVEARVRREPAFARGLLEEAVQALLGDELAVARNTGIQLTARGVSPRRPARRGMARAA